MYTFYNYFMEINKFDHKKCCAELWNLLLKGYFQARRHFLLTKFSLISLKCNYCFGERYKILRRGGENSTQRGRTGTKRNFASRISCIHILILERERREEKGRKKEETSVNSKARILEKL
jgi:hypothetical protein